MTPVDHLLWGCPDLDSGTAALAALTGVAPKTGGSHPGGGTRNTLLSLGPACYLEIIAPDPAQPAQGTPAEWLGKLARPGLVTWVVRCDLERLEARLAGLPVKTKGIAEMSRKTAEGGSLRWKVLRLHGHGLGPVVPFFIDWLDTPHPGGSTPQGCRLEGLELGHPDPAALGRLLGALEIAIPIVQAPAVSLRATLATPKGEVRLESASPLPRGWRDE